jgi:hypothetical protein
METRPEEDCLLWKLVHKETGSHGNSSPGRFVPMETPPQDDWLL